MIKKVCFVKSMILFLTVSEQAKMLEEMDAEFGIGGLIEEEFGTKKKVNKYAFYASPLVMNTIPMMIAFLPKQLLVVSLLKSSPHYKQDEIVHCWLLESQ
jgi:hypothetical protein